MLQRRPIFLAPLILIFSFVATASAALAAPAKELRVIQLQQTHYFLGQTLVTAGRSGLRIESTGRLNFILVAHAPDWDVTVFRNDDKKYKKLPMRVFDIAGLMPQFVQTFRPRLVPSAAPPFDFTFFGLPAKRVTNRYQNHEYIPLGTTIAPEAERILFAAYRLPTGGGLPLRYIGTTETRDFIGGIVKKGSREVALTTSRARSITVPADYFSPPKNYTAVKDMQEVTVGSQGRKQSEDFQTMFGAERTKTK